MPKVVLCFLCDLLNVYILEDSFKNSIQNYAFQNLKAHSSICIKLIWIPVCGFSPSLSTVGVTAIAVDSFANTYRLCLYVA